MSGTNRAMRIGQPRVALVDPHTNTDSADLLSVRWALYDPLVTRTGPATFAPALASAWSCAPDARTWTVQLGTAAFSDGAQLTPADVVASLRRVSDPALGGEMATAGVLAGYLGDARIEPHGRDAVRIVTAEPMADLLDLLADIAITRAGDASIGSGPFTLAESGDGRLTLVANPRHWRGEPQAAQVHFAQMPSSEQRVEALVRGDVDIISGVAPHDRAMLESGGNLRVTATPGSLCVIFMLNCAAGVCADARVRQALNHALDVERIIAVAAGGAAQRTNGPLTTLHAGYDPAVVPYQHDPERARALLATAGYPDGLDLTIDLPTRLPDEAPLLGLLLEEQLAVCGVRVTLRSHPDRLAYAHMVRNKQIADGCCFDSSPISTYRVLREKLHSGHRGPWWQGYRNPQVDALLDQATRTTDDAQRNALYRQVSRSVHADAPWLFLYAPYILHGVGPRLPDWNPGLNGVLRFAPQ